MMLDILKNLQKELAVFFISIAITTVIIVVSQSWWQSSFENKRTSEYELNETRQKYYTALDQKLLLEAFEKKHDALKKSGIYGNEDRLNWVDVIEKTTARFKIPYLKYRIEKRKKITSPSLKKKYPAIDVFKSSMSLQMQLLHEGDLYSVLNNLEKNVRGLFDIQSCIISRNPSQNISLIDSATDKNFSANCILNWYTIQSESAKQQSRRAH